MLKKLLVIALLLLTLQAMAQDNPNVLVADTPANGTLSVDNVADVYTFDAIANASITLTATSETLPLSLLLTNSQGVTLAEATADGSGSTTIADLTLTQGGTTIVTVFAAATAPGPNGSYQIALSVAGGSTDTTTVEPTPVPTQAPVTTQPAVTSFTPPQDILIGNGIEVRLQWTAAVDLNLEVRDPLGNSLYFDNRTTPIGGTFGFDANGVCEIISDAPVETATWQPGFLPTGSYEVLIFYVESCAEGTPAPVDFTLTVLVNGIESGSVQGTVSPPPVAGQDSVYLSSFTVNNDATASVDTGGYYPDSSINQLPATTAQITSNPTPVTRGIPVTGVLAGDQSYLTYSFDAQANEVLTINMSAISGNLDTLLQLVGPSGSLLQVNDDAPGTTNSSIGNYRIIQAGRYTLVATRYGKEFGGTEGQFTILISETSSTLPSEISNLTLPSGEVQVYLTWATNADLQLLVRDPAGEAVYDDNPRVTSGGILAANGNANCQLTDTNPVSYVYWPLGFLRPGVYEVEIWYQNTCDETLPTEFTLTTVVNEQVIASERRVPSIGQRFIMTFEVNNDSTAQAGPGGFLGEGISTLSLTNETLIPIQFSQPVNGSITLDNDFDVYTFSGRAGQVVTVSMTATSQTLDTNLYLLDPNSVLVASNDDADPNLIIGAQGRVTDSLISAFTLQTDGDYRIIATRFGTQYGGTIGTYRLTLQPN